ncbi:M15 family metallopeptidase [Nocardioides psychrotolerans]|uniref:M15 family metallopeptidase n=1 Tax=Nocardioides psychrotolerans TaxID=1005945 RepID=UPI0031382551
MHITRALTATGLVVALAVLPSCASPSEGEEPGTQASTGAEGSTPAASTPGDPGGSGAPSAPALDPAYAVDPPGPREGAIEPSDMILIGKTAFSDETVAAIEGIKGIQRVVSFSHAQVTVEGNVLDIAAVDPSTYRNYTPVESADLQEVWDRVAAGEVAVLPELRKQLPIDKAGFVRLGVEEDAPQVHVGAFAPQSPLVDAVVNSAWGEELGMTPGNALLISTGIVAPQSVRKAVQAVAGDGVSVQLTDVATSQGIDPSVQQTAVLVGSVADVVGTFNYTVIGGGRIAPEPAWVASHISTEEIPILGSVTCNRFIFPQLRAAFEEIVARGLSDEINPGEYAGCYYPRFIAGSTSLSNHSFGTALDLNVPGNLRGTVGEMDRQVVAIMKKWGFAWGGDWRYTDPMHFEVNALVDPR